MDDPKRYEGMTVKVGGIVAQCPKFPRKMYEVGRFAMGCCAEETAIWGRLCTGPEQKQLKTRDWVEVTAQVRIKNLKVLGGEGPVLYTTQVTPCQAPKDDLIYF